MHQPTTYPDDFAIECATKYFKICLPFDLSVIALILNNEVTATLQDKRHHYHPKQPQQLFFLNRFKELIIFVFVFEMTHDLTFLLLLAGRMWVGSSNPYNIGTLLTIHV